MKALRIYSIALGIAAILFAGCSGSLLDLTPEMQNVLNNYYIKLFNDKIIPRII